MEGPPRTGLMEGSRRVHQGTTRGSKGPPRRFTKSVPGVEKGQSASSKVTLLLSRMVIWMKIYKVNMSIRFRPKKQSLDV